MLLGQTLTSSEGKHGTQALGTVHQDVLDAIAQSDANAVAATITRDLLWPFAQFNLPGVRFERMPRLVIAAEQYQDIKAMAESLPALVKLGAQIPVGWLHAETGIPMAKPGDAVLQDTPTPPALQDSNVSSTTHLPDSNAATSRHLAALAAQLRQAQSSNTRIRQVIAALAATPSRTTALDRAIPPDDIDLLVQDALTQLPAAMQPLVQPLLDEIDALEEGDATSLQSLLDRLPSLLTRMDSAQLAALLTQVGTIAHLAGSAGVANGIDLVD
ncbi:MAG: DUF935 family protein [Rhodoferax sp.]|nr:DUF935 family protein [Rhodoferax sp.]